MARVFYGDEHVFSTMLHGETDPYTRRFLESQHIDEGRFRGIAGDLHNRVKGLYERIHDSDLLARTRAAIRKIEGVFTPDDIRPLRTIGALQQARPRMRRVIMANPYVRELYQKQRIEGYSKYYKDDFPTRPTDELIEYQQVMSGIVEVSEEGDTSYELYMDVEHETHDEISMDMDQQVDSILTWNETIRLIRKGKEDPTSTINSFL